MGKIEINLRPDQFIIRRICTVLLQGSHHRQNHAYQRIHEESHYSITMPECPDAIVFVGRLRHTEKAPSGEHSAAVKSASGQL
jgi:hypothetical protein